LGIFGLLAQFNGCQGLPQTRLRPWRWLVREIVIQSGQDLDQSTSSLPAALAWLRPGTLKPNPQSVALACPQLPLATSTGSEASGQSADTPLPGSLARPGCAGIMQIGAERRGLWHLLASPAPGESRSVLGSPLHFPCLARSSAGKARSRINRPERGGSGSVWIGWHLELRRSSAADF
jgi:hypothetical protein